MKGAGGAVAGAKPSGKDVKKSMLPSIERNESNYS